VLSATLIEARKITDKRHDYRGRVCLIDLGNGSEKARINSPLISGGWPFPMGSGAPKGPLQVPELFGESWGQNPAKTTSALEQLTDSSRTLRQVRKVPIIEDTEAEKAKLHPDQESPASR